jgi:crotonobetainyl-CoA:carnitine CoA-transferase CaiB-like acyl-CoA transferase
MLIFLPQIYRPPPYLGEHTDEVLSEFGYSASDIESFRKNGAL